MFPTPTCKSKKMIVKSEYGRMLHDKSSCRENHINWKLNDDKSKCMFDNSSFVEFPQTKIPLMSFLPTISKSVGVDVDPDT